MKSSLIVVTTILFSLTTHAQDTGPSYSVEDLYSLIDSVGNGGLEAVLSKLPDDLRTNFTVFKKSKSRQKGPRTVLFRLPKPGVNGEIVAIGFKHIQDGKVGDKELEVMAFNPNPSPNQPSTELTLIPVPPNRDGMGKIIRKSANSTQCTSCHGTNPEARGDNETNPHAIWDAYPNWEGNYGELDDLVGVQDREELPTVMKASLLRYLTPQGTHLTRPYEPPGSSKGTAAYRPNLRLGILLSRLGSNQIGRNLKSKILYRKWRPFVVLAAFHCRERSKSLAPGFGSVVDQEIARDFPVGTEKDSRASPKNDLDLVLSRMFPGFGISIQELFLLRESRDEPPTKLDAFKRDLKTGFYAGRDGMTSQLFMIVLHDVFGLNPLLRQYDPENIADEAKVYKQDFEPIANWDWKRLDTLSWKPREVQPTEIEENICPKLATMQLDEFFKSAMRSKGH